MKSHKLILVAGVLMAIVLLVGTANAAPSSSPSLLSPAVAKKVYKLTSAAYQFLKKKQTQKALPLFLQAQVLDPNDTSNTMQLGYMFAELGDNKRAYNEFSKAAAANDLKFKQSAENALINLSSYHYQVMPKPWFTDIYFAPQYSGYYDDFIYATKFRSGVAYGKNGRLELYASLRYDRDTRSGVTNSLPQIFNDNIVDPALGVRYRFSEIFPIAAYFEWGITHKFVGTDSANWQKDIRAGFDFDKNWGVAPQYAMTAQWQWKPIGDAYGDVAYYSLYDDNIIGELRIRQGYQFFTWKNSSAGIYLKGDYLFDTKKLYYNNLVKVGPGLVITPYNRLNLNLRIEPTWANYIDGGPLPNPHSNRYYDTMIIAEFYIRF